MKKCGIYKIENRVNHKVYIGQSIDIETRWSAHRRCGKYHDKENYFLYQAINKYGIDSFDFTILEECNECNLDEKEIYYIQKYDSYKHGYNMTLGGKGTVGGNINSRNKAPKNIKQFCNNDITEIAKLDKSFNVIEYYPSVQEAARQNHVEATNISKTLKGKYKYCGGYIYMYADVVRELCDNVNDLILYRLFEDLYPYHSDTDSRNGYTCKVQILDSHDNVLAICNTINEASKKYNIDASTISKICKGKLKQSKGYKFQYV